MQSKKIRVLFLEEDPDGALLIQKTLDQAHAALTHFESVQASCRTVQAEVEGYLDQDQLVAGILGRALRYAKGGCSPFTSQESVHAGLQTANAGPESRRTFRERLAEAC